MVNYKLLTPGPLTTTDSVKREMMADHCTWDEDYKQVTQKIRRGLLKLAHVSEGNYTAVLMQGSGTFGVEAVLTSVIGENDKLLIIANGAYGKRMGDIAEHAKINYVMYNEAYHQIPSAEKTAEILKENPEITHVSMVHSETTSGILNDIAAVTKVVKSAGKTMIVDAMSSFGGVDIPVEALGIDFIISSANKCIQGVPGFSFIICNREKLMESRGKARSLSLDLYDQWETMEKDGKWRFTSPTHTVLVFAKAMEELEAEGGIPARSARYYGNNRLLIRKMKDMGIQTYIGEAHQGPIITTFLFPENHKFSFEEMYQYVKDRGYAIYPGKVTDADTFRIGNIGEIYEEDILKLCSIFKEFFENMENRTEAVTEAVIFDWAGTTVDYGCFAPVRAFIEVFREAGIEPTMEEVREPMGMLKWDHIRTMLEMPGIRNAWMEKYGRAAEDSDADRLYASFQPSLMAILDQYAGPKPYVTETINKIREKGIKIGSTTGYTDSMMSVVVPKAAEMGYAPDCWFSPDSTEGKGRPYPYMIFKNMQALGVSSTDKVIKVGDTVSDILEGKNAGVFTIGILEGSSVMGLSEEEYAALSEEEKAEKLSAAEKKYRDAGADAVVRDIRGVLEYI